MKHFFILFVVIATMFSSYCALAQQTNYCVAQAPTPVFNTLEIAAVFGGEDGTTVRVDEQGLIRELEFIALEKTVFEIRSRYPKGGYEVFQVQTNDYLYDNDLYIDSRFVTCFDGKPKERTQRLPSQKEILERLFALEGQSYLWGGNVSEGIPRMIEFYQPSGEIGDLTRRLWKLEGVDCSGLLYQATNGYTPRNTSSLVHFGDAVDISGLRAEEIARIVQPLDLIVWPGHVIIVFDEQSVIESAQATGVKRTHLLEKLKAVLGERTPADEWLPKNKNSFVIRRWHSILTEL